MLKALSNGCFLPILLDGKRRGNKRSLSKKKVAKVVEASSEDDFLIIPLYWPSLCLFGTSIDVYRKNYVENSGGDDPGPGTGTDKSNISTDTSDTDDTDGEADNLGRDINTPNADRKANDRKADDLSTGIDTLDVDRGANNRKADNPNTDTVDADTDADERADLSKKTVDINAKRQTAASNKTHASLFSLYKAFFFVFFFWIGDRFRLSTILNHFLIVSSNLGKTRSPFSQISVGGNMHVQSQ